MTWPHCSGNSNPKMSGRPAASRLPSHFFSSPLAVTSLSYAWSHEHVPARCHVSTATAEWILGNGHHKTVFMSELRPEFPLVILFFSLNFIVVTACQSCFVCIFLFFVTFDTLWTISVGPVTVHQLRCENDVPQSFLLLLF